MVVSSKWQIDDRPIEPLGGVGLRSAALRVGTTAAFVTAGVALAWGATMVDLPFDVKVLRQVRDSGDAFNAWIGLHAVYFGVTGFRVGDALGLLYSARHNGVVTEAVARMPGLDRVIIQSNRQWNMFQIGWRVRLEDLTAFLSSQLPGASTAVPTADDILSACESTFGPRIVRGAPVAMDEAVRLVTARHLDGKLSNVAVWRGVDVLGWYTPIVFILVALQHYTAY